MKSVAILVLFLVSSLVPLSSSATTPALKCAPTEVNRWPNNVRVEVSTVGAATVMKVTSNYYGVDLDEKYSVTKNSGMLGKAPVDIYSAPGATLTVNTVLGKSGYAAKLVSDKDGTTELSCQPAN